MTVRAVVLLSLVLVAAPAFGQGTVTGVVTGPGGVRPGEALPGALVELFAAGSPGDTVRTAISRGDGRYELSDVPADTYSLTVQLPGFASFRRDNVAVTRGATVTIDALLLPQVDETFRFQFPPPRGGLLPPFEIPDEPYLSCLHRDRETITERMRRADAQQAMRVIQMALGMLQARTPTWEELASSPAVATLRQTGTARDLANRIQWGSSEPLPGWGIAWMRADTQVRYALVDLRDPCGFSITSEGLSGTPASEQQFRVLPLS